MSSRTLAHWLSRLSIQHPTNRPPGSLGNSFEGDSLSRHYSTPYEFFSAVHDTLKGREILSCRFCSQWGHSVFWVVSSGCSGQVVCVTVQLALHSWEVTVTNTRAFSVHPSSSLGRSVQAALPSQLPRGLVTSLRFPRWRPRLSLRKCRWARAV